MVKRAAAGIGAVLLAGTVAVAWAEKAPLAPDKLREIATHVVIGEVRAIYTRTELEGPWRYTRFVAEVAVDTVEKGANLTPGGLVYVRYWTRAWAGPGQTPASTSGHRGLPERGEKLRIYLATKAYDGFNSDNADGGFNVIGANGFERLTLPATRPAGG